MSGNCSRLHRCSQHGGQAELFEDDARYRAVLHIGVLLLMHREWMIRAFPRDHSQRVPKFITAEQSPPPVRKRIGRTAR
jgi:hypothetical protein